MNNLNRLIDLGKTPGSCVYPGCLEGSTDWGTLCIAHELEAQQDLQDDIQEDTTSMEEKLETLFADASNKSIPFCTNDHMDGAPGYESCLLCGKTHVEHTCSHCSKNKRMPGFSYCLECHENKAD